MPKFTLDVTLAMILEIEAPDAIAAIEAAQKAVDVVAAPIENIEQPIETKVLSVSIAQEGEAEITDESED